MITFKEARESAVNHRFFLLESAQFKINTPILGLQW